MKGLSEDAERLILEFPGATERTSISLLISLLILTGGLIFPGRGLGDSWACELDSSEETHAFMCRDLRSIVGCRNISGPVRTEILLNVKAR